MSRRKFVIAARYSFAHEAQLAKASLEAAGIDAVIDDLHTINMQWFYSDALGGVKLRVDSAHLEEAQAILAQDFSADVEQTMAAVVEPPCPQCGATDADIFTEGKKPKYVVYLLLGIPSFFYKHGLKCNRCGHFWQPHRA